MVTNNTQFNLTPRYIFPSVAPEPIINSSAPRVRPNGTAISATDMEE